MKSVLMISTCLFVSGCAVNAPIATNERQELSYKPLNQVWLESEQYRIYTEKYKKIEQEKLMSCQNLSKTLRSVTIVENSKIEIAVKDTLKDPYSAHFKDVIKVSAYDECLYGVRFTGSVNAKNSYGGYVGYKFFEINSAGQVFDRNSQKDSDYSDAYFNFTMVYLTKLRER